MTIILDHYTIPKIGPIEMLVKFNLNVTAEEAQRKVDRWLLEQVTLRSVDWRGGTHFDRWETDRMACSSGD